MSDTAPRRVTVAGVSALIRGSGSPVLMLHGIGGNARTFDSAAQLLAEKYLAIAWDAPGYGASPDPSATLGVDGYLQAVRDLLHHLGHLPAHIIGTSWGGVIATYLAARHPQDVQSLTLLDSTRGSAVDTERAKAMRARPAALEREGASAFARQRAARLTAPGAAPEQTARVEELMSQVRPRGYESAAEFMADADTGPLLPGITVPTLVIVGEHDRVTGLAESRLLASTIPRARLEIVAAAGHAAVQEQPGPVVDLISPFMSDAESAHAQVSP